MSISQLEYISSPSTNGFRDKEELDPAQRGTRLTATLQPQGAKDIGPCH